MLRQLDYQDRVLKLLDTYLDTLKAKKAEADEIATIAAGKPHLKFMVPDFAKEAWDAMAATGALPASRAAIPFSPREDECGRPVPNTVRKVPTGGGKTWLAIQSLSHIMGRYLGTNTGFVLWIVPNEAIYSQTLKHLKDRQHFYRRALDQAAAGRVLILEKGDRLNARDVEGNLCVMLLMLQSATRRKQEQLKMFGERGDIQGFFPAEGDQAAHKAEIEATPNLDAYNDIFPMVKDSLGNALRKIRPIVVLDEGHKAISDLAFKTLYGFNPAYVLELTATPLDIHPRGGANPREGRYANLLVEVTGIELDREGMIKMPLNLDTRQGTDWRGALSAAVDKLDDLQAKANHLRADTNRYIRPIMLVQVERTGKDQRDSGHIHADAVKEWLLAHGFDEAEIAIKTAETNDLKQPENLDLLSPTNRVRAIITKQALQEGWDCPFAYVLCALAANSNLNAMTQLVGRILRQPGPRKVDVEGFEDLDECHVITHRAATGDVVGAIKDGLEKDGLGDLVLRVASTDPKAKDKGSRRIDRRPAFATTQVYLPLVLKVEGNATRELDYETDILSALDWRGFDPTAIANGIPENAQAAESQLQRITVTDAKERLQSARVDQQIREVRVFDPAYTVRRISDIVPNPFVGREIVGKLITRLEERGFGAELIGRLSILIGEELRRGLEAARSDKAEVVFKDAVKAGDIQFRLRVDGQNWQVPNVMETTMDIGSRQLQRSDGSPLQLSLFSPVYEDELNKDEQAVAVYLDEAKTLRWWHRNVASRQYGIPGWRRGRVYPDFIFASQQSGKGSRIVVLETKGDQLDNLDTAYKRELLNVLSGNFAWDTTTAAGTLAMTTTNGETVECALVLLSEWPSKLPTYL